MKQLHWTSNTFDRILTLIGWFAPGALAALMIGCSSQPETTAVSGKVYAVHPTTGKKEPMVYGTVFLLNVKYDEQFEGEIQPDGRYTIKEVLPGKAKVTVSTEHPLRWQDKDIPAEQRPKRPSDEVVRKWFPINKLYESADESSLEIDVTPGGNVDIFLKIPHKKSGI